MSATILKPEFGSTLQVVVEVAWGVDPRSDPTGWTWTDITTDTLTTKDHRIDIHRGRADESSTAQPATMTLGLKNITGKYSQGAKSANYPNVKRGVPIRVRLILSSTSYTRFWGYVTSWSPSWSFSTRKAIVVVSAHGTLKRLGQGKKPLKSVMARGVPAFASNPPVAYWPCEDEGSAISMASGIPKQSPITFTRGRANFASYGGFLCSKPLPTANKASWHGRVPRYTQGSPNKAQISFLFNAPATGVVDGTVICQIYAESTGSEWLIRWYNGGNLKLELWDHWGTNFFTGSLLTYAAGIGNSAIQLQLEQNGTGITTRLGVYNIDLDSFAQNTQTVANMNLGKIDSVHMFAWGENDSMAAGHIIVQKNTDTFPAFRNYWLAYTAESPTARITRLATELGEPITVLGTSPLAMGEQLPQPYIDLLQECANTEIGLVADGINQGLTYYSRESTQSTAPVLTLDFSKGQLARFEPVDDDALNVNDFTASRTGGGTVQHQNVTGPFGINAIGQYENSAKFNTQNDQELPHYANYMLRRGSKFSKNDATNYRYPTVPVRLVKSPSLATAVLGTDLLERIDVKNVGTIIPQMENLTLSLHVQGYEETISATNWDVTFNCTPYDHQGVAVYATTTGDTGEFVGRFDSDGSTLASTASSGATSLSVSTPSGPVWTTASDDFPFVIEVLDIPVTVTAISGTGTTQTFTVSGVTKTLASGSAVTLWNAPVMGL